MKKFLSVAAAVMALSLAASPAFANDAHHTQAEAQKTYTAKGEVVSLNAAVDKLKLKHEAVPELNWPGMTMDFLVADKALLNEVKAGDKVEFQFELVAGAARVTQIKHLK